MKQPNQQQGVHNELSSVVDQTELQGGSLPVPHQEALGRMAITHDIIGQEIDSETSRPLDDISTHRACAGS